MLNASQTKLNPSHNFNSNPNPKMATGTQTPKGCTLEKVAMVCAIFA